jgi:hypothetical protein
MDRRQELLAFWRAWKEALEEPTKTEALVKLMAELDHTIRAAAARFRNRGWAEIPLKTPIRLAAWLCSDLWISTGRT